MCDKSPEANAPFYDLMIEQASLYSLIRLTGPVMDAKYGAKESLY